MRAATFLKPLAATALTAAAILGALKLRRRLRSGRPAPAAAESERRDWRVSMPLERLDEELDQTFPASDPIAPRHVD
jgi:hypothetical protein